MADPVGCFRPPHPRQRMQVVSVVQPRA